MEVSAIRETRAMVLEPIHCPKCDGIEVINTEQPQVANNATFVRTQSALDAHLFCSIAI